MAELSRDEVVGVLGRLSDVIIAEIIATGITKDELAAARERAGAQSPTQREATMIRQFEIRWSDLGYFGRLVCWSA